ncbi:MAG TPA: hypothetical protein VMU72_01135 [Gaiellaceae bacterium]|nr:hypothetical protein [Gaiellaceae bacterium]
MADVAPRLPFALDPLIAEAKQGMRRRRQFYISLAAVAIGSLALGLTVGLRPSSGLPPTVVPTNVSEIEIHALVGPATAAHIRSWRITKPMQVTRIVGWFNSLTSPLPPLAHCAGSYGSSATFRFRSANGSELVRAGFPPANDLCGEPLQLAIRGQQARFFASDANGLALITRLKRLLGPRYQPTMGGAG